jgi:hypothetical protein
LSCFNLQEERELQARAADLALAVDNLDLQPFCRHRPRRPVNHFFLPDLRIQL